MANRTWAGHPRTKDILLESNGQKMTQNWNQAFQPGLWGHSSAQMDSRGHIRALQAQLLEEMRTFSQLMMEWNNQLKPESSVPRSAEGPIISIKAPPFKRLFNGESDYEIRDFLKDFETHYRMCSDQEKRDQLRSHLGKRAVQYYDNEEIAFQSCESFEETKQKLIEYFDDEGITTPAKNEDKDRVNVAKAPRKRIQIFADFTAKSLASNIAQKFGEDFKVSENGRRGDRFEVIVEKILKQNDEKRLGDVIIVMAGSLNVLDERTSKVLDLEPKKIGSGLSLESLDAIAKERPVFLFSVPHQHMPKYDPLNKVVNAILRENAGRCRHLMYQSLVKLDADEYRTVWSPGWVTRELSESARQKIANFVFKTLRQHKVAESSPKSFPGSNVRACGETTARGSKRTFSDEDTEILPRDDCKRAKICKVQNNFSVKEVLLSNLGYDFSDSDTVYHEPMYVGSVNFMQDKNVKREVYSNDKFSSEVKEVTEQTPSLSDRNDANFGSNASLSSVSDSAEEIGASEEIVEPVTERRGPDTFESCKSEEGPAACETQDGDVHNIQIFPTGFVSSIEENGTNDHFDQQETRKEASKLEHEVEMLTVTSDELELTRGLRASGKQGERSDFQNIDAASREVYKFKRKSEKKRGCTTTSYTDDAKSEFKKKVCSEINDYLNGSKLDHDFSWRRLPPKNWRFRRKFDPGG